ncbi:MAG TPA: rhodanese-like domain-containing protein [Acidiferrobacterales bacterium]|jgi:rhodanese-related sulfurtransferase
MRQITVSELKDRLDAGDSPLLLDVREPWELRVCALPGALHIPMRQVPARLGELDPDREIVVVCHHGVRSYQVVRFMEQQGFTNAINLAGGVDAWAREVDPEMAKY